MDDQPIQPYSGAHEAEKTDLKGENILFRALASLGMAPTSPRQARPQRIKITESEHPASGNEEIADDVVRVQRVSEEEEAERYFSAFSFYTT
jgi:hypothetical protein